MISRRRFLGGSAALVGVQGLARGESARKKVAFLGTEVRRSRTRSTSSTG